MIKAALISDCGDYRYWLSRKWGEGPPCLFIMLNPSTADADKDDPTIRRCISFAKNNGYGELIVVNLFAYRSANPLALRKIFNHKFETNDAYIKELALGVVDKGGICIAAWGFSGTYMNACEIAKKLFIDLGVPLYCLGITTAKSPQPKHPLYLPANTQIIRYV